jgi:hypothetical protein
VLDIAGGAGGGRTDDLMNAIHAVVQENNLLPINSLMYPIPPGFITCMRGMHTFHNIRCLLAYEVAG